MNSNLSVLHQNIQSISNKQIEIYLVLKSSLKNTDVLFYRALGKGGLFKINSDRSV